MRQYLLFFVRSPLLWLALVVAAQFQFRWDPPSLDVLGWLFVMAYLQNTAYTMQSRGATRNNNAYHLIGALFAGVTFFMSLQIVVSHNVTLSILAVYVFATVLGTVNGSRFCIFIEQRLGIYVSREKMREMRADPVKLLPSLAILLFLLVTEITRLSFGGVVAEAPGGGTVLLGADVLTVLAVVSMAGGFTHTMLRTARSTDSYTFHAVMIFLNIVMDFIKLYYLIAFQLNWALFIPVVVGGTFGGLVGANLAQAVAKRINAKFDIKVFKKDEMSRREAAGLVTWPTRQIVLFSSFLVVQGFLVATGTASLVLSCGLFFLAGWREMSFTLKSRAGNRDNLLYLAWVSVFSNGVWFLTLKPLALDGVTLDKAIPYIVGCSIGSLVGQLVGMKIEALTGARVDHLPEKTAAKPVPA